MLTQWLHNEGHVIVSVHFYCKDHFWWQTVVSFLDALQDEWLVWQFICMASLADFIISNYQSSQTHLL